MSRAIVRWAGSVALLVAINLFIFQNHWQGRATFTFDFVSGYYATVAYWISSLQSGEWPQWIPYQSMGYPILMNPQIGICYPPFWIFVLLHIPYTLHAAVIFQVLHILFGSIGFLLLANRLFGSLPVAVCGAVAFMFFGGFYSNAEHADIIRGFAWMPWLLWAAMLTDLPRFLSIRGRVIETRLAIPSFAMPLMVACFVTGAYMGQVIAGLLLLGIFAAVQAAQRAIRYHDGMAFRDLAFQYALAGLGVAMAAPFLIPGFYLTRETVRAQGVSIVDSWVLTGRNLFGLIFPSNILDPATDYSMLGMQLPIVMWLFIGLVRPKQLRKLLPFLAIGFAAALMSFDTFFPVSRTLRHWVPVLALSRFPSGDYREFFYLAILLTTLAGLSAVMEDWTSPWRKATLALCLLVVFGLVCLVCLQHDISPPQLKPFLGFAKLTTVIGMATVAVLFGACLLARPWLLAFVVPLLIVGSMFPLIQGESRFWSDRDVLKNLYDGQGYPLAVNGRLRSLDIFRRHESARPPRQVGSFRPPACWGYLTGAYMMNDRGGSVPLSRVNVESDPNLTSFMRQGSKLVAIACQGNAGACVADINHVPVSDQPNAGSVAEYSRNYVVYDVQLLKRSLVIENEINIEGWQAMSDGKPVSVKKVDRSLRGWVLPAGHHQVRLDYHTPWLPLSLGLSALATAAWLGLFICVILMVVAPDRWVSG